MRLHKKAGSRPTPRMCELFKGLSALDEGHTNLRTSTGENEVTLADELDAAGAEAQRLGDSALAIKFWLLALRAAELEEHPKTPVAEYLRRVASWRPPRQPVCRCAGPQRPAPVQINFNQCVIDALIVSGD